MPGERYCTTWEGVSHLHCGILNAEGLLNPGPHDIEFDEPIAMRVTVAADRSAMTALYHWEGSEAGFTQSDVTLDWRPCRFGGSRPYFRCPCCGRGALMLAVLRQGLVCGKCGKITWQSRREPAVGRRLRAANTAAKKLGCDSWTQVPERPKRMRHKTYEQLMAQWEHRVSNLTRTVTPGMVRCFKRIEQHAVRWK